MEGGTPTSSLPNFDVVTTTIDQDKKPAAHGGQRPTEPMCDAKKQDRTLLVLGVAATSGFVESIKTVQELCLTLCNTCRDNVPVSRLKVCRGVPPSIMRMVYPSGHQPEADDSSRVVPHRMVLKVNWEFFDSPCYRREEDDNGDGPRGEGPIEERGTEARDVGHTTVDDEIDISRIQWPMGTTDISFSFFNRGIDAMIWPPGLKRLRFGHRMINTYLTFRNRDTFNMPLDAATLPGGLREIFLGIHFNQPIEGVAWPEGLERLSLPGFNHSIKNVQWPPGLKSLEFVSPSNIGRWDLEDIGERLFPDYVSSHEDFDSSQEYRNPTNVTSEKDGFNQPLGTTLPPSLETLWLSENFHQPLNNVAWPVGITFLGLASESVTCVPGFITWPLNLQHLCMAEKPHPDEGFSFPPDCKVSIIFEACGGGDIYDHVVHYDRDEDPNDVEEEADQYDGYDGNNDDIYYYSDEFA